MRPAWRCALAFGLGAWVGCDAGAFHCEDDVECRSARFHGVCQPAGYCSFPDAGCDSGQRYGEHAGDALGRECVEPEESADEGNDDDGVPPRDGESGGADPTQWSLTSRYGCQRDDFDDEVIDPSWCSRAPDGIVLTEGDGVLSLEVVSEASEQSVQVGQIGTCEPRPLLGIVATARVVATPLSSPNTEAFLEVGNHAFGIGVAVIDDRLRAFEYAGGDYAYTTSSDYEPDAHQYWRIRGASVGLVVEVSADGEGWTHLYTLQVDLANGRGDVSLGIRGDGSQEVDITEYDWLELCARLG